MGSMTTDLPVPYTAVTLNGWEIIGQFVYPAQAYLRLLDLLRSGLLDVSPIPPRVYPAHCTAGGHVGRGESEQS